MTQNRKVEIKISNKMIKVCDFAPTPTAICGEPAYYCTSVLDEEHGFGVNSGPDLCSIHLGARIESLLGRYTAVHVVKINK